ncbi:MAG: helix-turn-helix domain-containing protein [Deltaproteobacteria bacterium]|nr:helix-turn-helix domain-containing protein [Deltaproteobacteria bacterium]
MGKATTVPFPKIERILHGLGQNIRAARLRRRLTADLLAQRAGMTRNTLRSVERGEPNVTIGAYANVLHVLGLAEGLEPIALDDELGRKLQDASLGVRARAPKRKG